MPEHENDSTVELVMDVEAGTGTGNETVKTRGTTAIADAVEESAVNSAGAEVASAVAGESLKMAKLGSGLNYSGPEE